MGLGYHFAKVFADILRSGSLDVSHVNLSRNKLKDEGIREIAAVLIKIKTIIHLDVSQNEISEKGASELFDYLIQNESIVSLDIGCYDGQSRNRIGARGL